MKIVSSFFHTFSTGYVLKKMLVLCSGLFTTVIKYRRKENYLAQSKHEFRNCSHNHPLISRYWNCLPQQDFYSFFTSLSPDPERIKNCEASPLNVFSNKAPKFCWASETLLKGYCVFRSKVDYLLETLLLPQSSHETRGRKPTQKIIALQGQGIASQKRRPREK